MKQDKSLLNFCSKKVYLLFGKSTNTTKFAKSLTSSCGNAISLNTDDYGLYNSTGLATIFSEEDFTIRPLTFSQKIKAIIDEYKKKLIKNNLNIKRFRPNYKMFDLTNGGIYFLFDEYGQVIYIGQSKSVFSRIEQHRRDKDFKYFRILRCNDDRIRKKFEEKLIRKFKPDLNKNYLDGKRTNKMCSWKD